MSLVGTADGRVRELPPSEDAELCDPVVDQSYGEQPNDWPSLRAIVLHRDHYECRECGATATDVDHIWPKSRGGADKLSNLRALCRECNTRKGDTLLAVHVTTDRVGDALDFEFNEAVRHLKQAIHWAAALRVLRKRFEEVNLLSEDEMVELLDRAVPEEDDTSWLLDLLTRQAVS